MIIEIINSISACAVPFMLVAIPLYGHFKGVRVYECFIEGAKEGISTAITIIPYLVAMLVAIGMFRQSGALDLITSFFRPLTDLIGVPQEVIPMGIMRSFSGAGAEGMLADVMTTHGPTSLAAKMGAVMMGSTETTFYVISIYCGSIGIKRTRHALSAGLTADLAGMIAAIAISLFVFT